MKLITITSWITIAVIMASHRVKKVQSPTKVKRLTANSRLGYTTHVDKRQSIIDPLMSLLRSDMSMGDILFTESREDLLCYNAK